MFSEAKVLEQDGLVLASEQLPEHNAEILDSLRRGEPEAFAALVAELHGSMIRIATSELGDDGLAEDVVQDTWLAVLRGLHRFENRSSLKTWILAILMRRAHTVAVRRRATSGLSDSAIAPFGLERQMPGQASPETRYLEREGTESIEKALSRLPPRQRQVFVLRQVEGRSSAEVGGLLGIAPANQRVLLHRARRRLQVLLGAREMPAR